MNNFSNTLKLLFGWPLSVIALAFISKLLVEQFSKTPFNFGAINISLVLLGTLCFVLYFLIRSIVWYIILRWQNYTISFYDSAYMWGFSELKRYIPGNIWSFLGRAVLFINRGVSKSDLWKSMSVEIILFLIACTIFSLLSLPYFLWTLAQWIPFKHGILYGLPLLTGVSLLLFLSYKKLPILSRFMPSITKFQIIYLIGLSLSYMFFYAVGSYLIAVAIAPIHPYYFLVLLGFFVFALLAGFLSIVTPMGLGVREGILTWGLAFIVPLSAAAFISLFSRILLVISEIVFLLLVILLNYTKNTFFIRNAHEVVLGFLITVYTFYFSWVSFLKHDAFLTGRFDLGNMDQTVWNTLHGNILQFTNPNGVTNMSRLGFHADFILAFLAPFYLLWSSPKMLLFVQTIVLASGAIFVYLLAKKVLVNKNISLALAFSYLLNPSIHFTNLYDFHAVTLATSFLLGAFYFLVLKKYIVFLLFFLLSAITKEQVWIVGIFFGLYSAIVQKNKKLGGIFALLSVAIFYYLIKYLIPFSRGGDHFALSYYAEFGDSPATILKSILLNPSKLFSVLFTYEKIHYLYQLLLPIGFLSLFSPFFLIFPSADFAINLLSNNTQLHQIYYQYTSVITPFIFVASIYGVDRIAKMYPRISMQIISIYIVVVSLITAYWYGPIIGAKNASISMFTANHAQTIEIREYLYSIPKSKKVAAINNIGAHVSQREHVYTVPIGLHEADIIILYPNDPYVLPPPEFQLKLIAQLQSNPQYKLVYKNEPFYAFEKIINGVE